MIPCSFLWFQREPSGSYFEFRCIKFSAWRWDLSQQTSYKALTCISAASEFSSRVALSVTYVYNEHKWIQGLWHSLLSRPMHVIAQYLAAEEMKVLSPLKSSSVQKGTCWHCLEATQMNLIRTSKSTNNWSYSLSSLGSSICVE